MNINALIERARASIANLVGATATWFRAHRRLGATSIAAAVVVVLASGAGIASAVVAGSAPATTPSATPSNSSTPTQTATAAPAATAPSDAGDFGGGWSPVSGNASGSGLGFRWNGNSLEVMWLGRCTDGPITVKVGAQNWGYLSVPRNGIQGVGGAGSTTLCQGGTGMMGTGDQGLGGPGYYKCFNFSEMWITVSGNSSSAGFYRQPIPSYVSARNCPADSYLNDPGAVWGGSLDQGLVPNFTGRRNDTWVDGTTSPGAPAPAPAPAAAPVPAPDPAPAPDPTPTPSSAPDPSPTPSDTPSASPTP